MGVLRCRSAALVLSLLVALAGCGDQDTEGTGTRAPDPSTSTNQADSATTAGTTDPLVGVWTTGPVAMARIRRTLTTAGYANEEIDKFLAEFGLQDARALQFRWRFYREGGQPFVLQQGWDPATGPPNDGDHGPYEMLPNNRVAITSADPEINHGSFVYAYDLAEGALRLRLISSRDPSVSKDQLRLENSWLYAATAAPYQLE